MKTCTKCKITKKESEFRFSLYHARLETQCIECKKEYQKNYRAANREARRESNREWNKKNPGASAKNSKKWRGENPEAHRDWKKKNPEKLSRGTLKRKYGITLEQYYEMFDRQKGVCDICGVAGKLKVDHNHQTGKVRGLLCQVCNTAIGMLRDSPELARKAAGYLEKHS